MSTPTQTALAKSETKKPAVITTADEYGSALERWTQARYNILSPFTTFTGLQEGYGLIASRVSIDPNPDNGEVYGKKSNGEKAPWIPDGHVALAKVGLRKIAECGGMSTSFRRTDPRTVAHYWEGDGIARWRGLDGTIVARETPFEWDMRDGSPRLKGFTPQQINEARKHGLRHCATRAINAAIREYGVKQVYTLAEMAKPFVIVRVVYLPDRSDPEVRRILTENALAGTSALYGQHAACLPPISGEVLTDDDELDARPVGRGSTSAPAAAPPTDGAPSADAVKVARVEEREFVYRNGKRTGEKGLRYVIVDSHGTEHSTFDAQHAKDAARFKAEDAWVEFSEESDGQYTNLLEIIRAGQQPTLLPDADKL